MTSIKEFQNSMKHLYFHRDSKRGSEETYNWLKEEISELGEAMANSNRTNLENEFADVMAWLASLANILEVDLERASLKKYDNRCPKCLSSPCSCPPR